MRPTLDVTARIAFAIVAVVVLFSMRWNGDIQLFDWQVWEASNNLIDQGQNPYDDVLLNDELRSDPDAYGDRFDDNFYLYLLNPPSWLATIRMFGSSVFLLNFLGASALFGSVAYLTRTREWTYTISAVLAAFGYAYLSPGGSTFQYGQIGLFVAGLVALHVVLLDRPGWGTPIAFLSVKPHYAAATALVGLMRKPRSAAVGIALPTIALMLVTAALIGGRSWLDWIDAILGGNAHPAHGLDDMSLATLTPALPWGDLGLIAVVAGIVGAGTIAWFGRHCPPAPIAFASLAVASYLSGHAFMHDWLWLPLVPAALKWNPIVGFGSITTITLVLTSRSLAPSLPVGYQSTVGLVITIALVSIAIRTILTHDSEADEQAGRMTDASIDEASAQAKLSANASS